MVVYPLAYPYPIVYIAALPLQAVATVIEVALAANGINNSSVLSVYIVRFEDRYEKYNSDAGYSYGAFVDLTMSDGTVQTTGTIYNNLEYRDINGFSQLVNGTTPLGLQETVPPDNFEITNFVYDKAAGVVTFDFSVTGQANRDYYDNSTGNEVTITGSVEASVYDNIVSRVGQ